MSSFKWTLFDETIRSIQQVIKEARGIEERLKEQHHARSMILATRGGHSPKESKYETMMKVLKHQWEFETELNNYRENYKKYKENMQKIDNLIRLNVFHPQEVDREFKSAEIHDRINRKNYKEEMEVNGDHQKRALREIQLLQEEVEDEREKEENVSAWEQAQVWAKKIIAKLETLEKTIADKDNSCSQPKPVEELIEEKPLLGNVHSSKKNSVSDTIPTDTNIPSATTFTTTTTTNISATTTAATVTNEKKCSGNIERGQETQYRMLVPPNYSKPQCHTRCIFCTKHHLSNECGNYQDVEERRKFIEEKGRCNTCLNYHPGTPCRKNTKCSFCCKQGVQDNSHHAALCLRPLNKTMTESELQQQNSMMKHQ
uniref:Uncharacterized protein n=1 Tax=Caenorhabditis tropicalis TaxID=1561998 RepID=A0A1I7V1D4_9PELO